MLKRCLFSALILLILTNNAFAGAWNQKKDDHQLIVTGRYYTTNHYTDAQGTSSKQPRYNSYEARSYYEYGVTDTLTLGANIAWQKATQDPSREHQGVDNPEFFLRVPLKNFSNGAVIALQPLIALPRLAKKGTPTIGHRGMDGEVKLLAGLPFTAFGQSHYVDVGMAYRTRTASGLNDQLRGEISLGVRPYEDWLFLTQFFHTEPLRDVSSNANSISQDQDYRASTAQLSAVYTLTPATSLQAGVFQEFNTRNAGRGNGGLLSVWWHF